MDRTYRRTGRTVPGRTVHLASKNDQIMLGLDGTYIEYSLVKTKKLWLV